MFFALVVFFLGISFFHRYLLNYCVFLPLFSLFCFGNNFYNPRFFMVIFGYIVIGVRFSHCLFLFNLSLLFYLLGSGLFLFSLSLIKIWFRWIFGFLRIYCFASHSSFYTFLFLDFLVLLYFSFILESLFCVFFISLLFYVLVFFSFVLFSCFIFYLVFCCFFWFILECNFLII